MKIQLNQIQSEEYIKIVKNENMDKMFDFGYDLGFEEGKRLIIDSNINQYKKVPKNKCKQCLTKFIQDDWENSTWAPHTQLCKGCASKISV